MKSLRLIVVISILLFSLPVHAAWSIVSSHIDSFSDYVGEHNVIKIIVTIDGSAGSFTTDDIDGAVRKYFKGYMYWVGIDGVDTGVAPQLTITDPWSFTRFNYTSFHATNPISANGQDYDGSYPQIFTCCGGSTFTFTDSGNNAQTFLMYIDMIR